MFKKKQKKQESPKNKEILIDTNESEVGEKELIERGMVSMKDLLAPPSIDRSNPDYLMVGKKYVRNFVMQGFPRQVYVGWLNDIFNYETDTMLHIEPADDREALDALTVKITQFEAQLATEEEKGSIRNSTRLRDIIQGLYEERAKLERNTEKLYQVQIVSNLYADSTEELDKETQKMDNKLRGRKIYLMPTYLRQDEGYQSVLPFGQSHLEEFRNFNSGALTACFPFYNGNISHENGVFCAVNLTTWNPVLIDFYDRTILNNSNITVIGQAGTGKTFFVSLLTMRSALKGIRSVIIDPEGEYRKLTDALGGAHINLAPGSNESINPFDIEEEDVLDSDGNPTGVKFVDIKEKVSDLLNLIAVMAGGLNGGQRSTVSHLLQSLYGERGINSDPNSLYVSDPYFDTETKELIHDGMKKTMPTFSDFHNALVKHGSEKEDEDIISLANTLRMFKKGGIYDLFDCHTSARLSKFSSSPIVTFNISQLEENVLRPIGMYVALSWTWEKFVKKNPHIKKRVVCDEAWMLVSKNMAGSEFTANFLENAARRIRKRNGGLLCASQNFTEFAESPQGKAVLNNAVVKIFLGQDSSDIELLQDTFKLSDGEKLFLLQAQRGEMLIRMHGEGIVAKVVPFEYEKQLIEKNA